MASAPHRYHPDPALGDPDDAIVWDDCPGCEENSRAPFAHMDSFNLIRIHDRLIEVVNTADGFRTEMEKVAARAFYDDLVASMGRENVKFVPLPIEGM